MRRVKASPPCRDLGSAPGGIRWVANASLCWLFASVLVSVLAQTASTAFADDATGPTASRAIPPESATMRPTPPAGQPTVGAVAGTGLKEVVSTIRHANGTVTYAYAVLFPSDSVQVPTLPGDVTSTDIPQSILNGTVSPTPDFVPSPGGGCDYGTATGFINPNTGSCPPMHWERFNTTVAYWYLEDHTGSAWPAYASQVQWNKSCCVGAYYAGTKCSSSFHCVPAHEVKYTIPCGSVPASAWVGCTFVTPENNSTNAHR